MSALSDLALRRLIAVFIDYIVLCVMHMCVCLCGFILTVNIWLQDGRKFMDIAWCATICSFLLTWLYFFFSDYRENIDVGKRIMKIELISEGQKLTVNKMLKHSILKWIFMAIWPLAIVYYLMRNEMIYDKYLKISVRDKISEI